MKRFICLVALCGLLIGSQNAQADNRYGWQNDVAFIESEGLVGLINRAEHILCEPMFDHGGLFGENDLACVKQGGRVGCVDRTGRIVIPFVCGKDLIPYSRWILPWTSSIGDDILVLLPNEGGKYGFFRASDGSLIGNRFWEDAFPQYNSFAYVKGLQGWNAIDVEGKLRYNFWADNISSNELCSGELSYHLDDMGNISEIWDESSEDDCVLAWYDTQSSQMHNSPWEKIIVLGSDRIAFMHDELWGLAAIDGTVIAPAQWDNIDQTNAHGCLSPCDEVLIVWDADTSLYGAINKNGQVIFPMEWNWLLAFPNGVFLGRMDDEEYYRLSSTGERLIKLPSLAELPHAEEGCNIYPTKDGEYFIVYEDGTMALSTVLHGWSTEVRSISSRDLFFPVYKKNSMQRGVATLKGRLLTAENWTEIDNCAPWWLITAGDEYWYIHKSTGEMLHQNSWKPSDDTDTDYTYSFSRVFQINGEYYFTILKQNLGNSQMLMAFANEAGQLVCDFH